MIIKNIEQWEKEHPNGISYSDCGIELTKEEFNALIKGYTVMFEIQDEYAVFLSLKKEEKKV